MPAYATNMRLKFPIVALTLEIITIILFAVFVVYDDGKGHGHDAHDNATHHEAQPMDLYPSKSTWGCTLRDALPPEERLVIRLFWKSLKVMGLLSLYLMF